MTTTPCDGLRAARDAVLGRPGCSGAALRAALSDAYDDRLGALVTDHRVALAAVGSLGRREPAPYSDLDLLLLHDGTLDDVARRAESVWYPVWDSGIGLDHAVRTVSETFAVADRDLRAMLGLLDVRHVAGDAALTERVRAGVRQRWRAGASRRAADLRGLCEQRWAVAGEAAYLLEPDLKDSRGGLRDAQVLRALALAQLIDLPVSVRSAYEFLLDAREAAQRSAARADDVLRRGDDEALRAVSRAARTVSHELDVAWRRAAPPGRRVLGGATRRRGVARDVVVQDGEVVLALAARPASDPVLGLRAARAAAENGLPLAAFALHRLVAELAPMPLPWPPEARAEFTALLGTGTAAVPVFEALDQAGLLVRLLPEWDDVRCRPQHNPVHRFTVDRHLLECAAIAASTAGTAGRVGRPDLLLVAALLHDIGKGSPGDHSEAGAVSIARIAVRMGYPEADVATLVGLVRHHLLLAQTATRRDLDDPRTIRTVSNLVGTDAAFLELLHALTIADARATGPAAWSDWKAALVRELVERTRASLAGTAPPVPPRFDVRHRRLAEAGRLSVEFEGSRLTVVAPDRVGVLYRTAGVLALHGLDVRSAVVRAHAGMVIDEFVVEPRFGRFPDPALLRGDLVRYLDGDASLAGRLRAKEASYPSRAGSLPASVHWFDDEATAATIVEYRGADRIGLLCRIAAALERCQLNVRSARVSCVAGSAVDVFYVTTRDGAPVPTRLRADVELELRHA